MTTALRELLIEARAAGRDPREAMKTGTLIMAAPDLDIGVARQRLIAERFAEAFEQIDIYANSNDRVLNLSRIVRAAALLGQLDASDFEAARSPASRGPETCISSRSRGPGGAGACLFPRQPGGDVGHRPDAAQPARAGVEFRPLAAETGNIWRLAPGYPAGPLPEVLDRASARAASGPRR